MSCAETGSAKTVSAARSNANRQSTTFMDMAKRRGLFRSGPSRHSALVHLGHGRQSFVEEALDPLTFVGFRGVEVALRVDRDAVHAVERSGLAAAIAEGRQLFQRLAIDDFHLLVHAVGHEDVLLLGVLR